MSGLEIVAFIMGGAGFVKDVLDTWDEIQKKRQERAEAELLARELQLFGLEKKRGELKDDLELSHNIAKNRTVPRKEKLELASEYQGLSKILLSIPDAVDAVIANSNASVIHFRRKAQAIKDMKSKLAAFSTALDEFHQRIERKRMLMSTKSSLELNNLDFKFVGENPKLEKVNSASYTADISYVASDQSSTVDINALIEPRHYADDHDTVKESTQVLTSKLHSADAAWNIPRLLGFRIDADKKLMELIFQRPQPTRELLSLARIYANIAEPSLNLRLKLCSQLAVAVLQLHTLGLVHKNIRPENLLIAMEKNDSGELTDASLYLAGWQNARMLQGVASARIGESSVSRAIYQHPNRYASNSVKPDGSVQKNGPAKEYYSIGHDIYSLGVCILELLTWDALVRPGLTKFAPPVLSEGYQRTFESLGYSKGSNLPAPGDRDEVSMGEMYTKNATQVQKTLVELAEKTVPRSAGDRMANLVNKCLTGQLAKIDSNDTEEVSDKFDSEVFADFNNLRAAL